VTLADLAKLDWKVLALGVAALMHVFLSTVNRRRRAK